MAEQRGRGRALALTVLSLIVGAVSYAGGVLNPVGQRAEASVLDAAAFTTSPPPPLNLVSIPSVLLVLLLTGGVALAVHGVRRAVTILGISAFAVIASQLLKQQFLQRPGLFELEAPNTFPSGHMTVFVVVVGAIMWAVPAQARAVIAFGGSILLAVVAWQLLAYGWHRPSDVIGAIALGVFAFALASVFSPGRQPRHAVLGRTVSAMIIIVGVLALVATAVIAGLALATGDDSRMLLVGQLGTTAAAMFSTRALLALSAR